MPLPTDNAPAVILANGEGRVGLQPAIDALLRQGAALDAVEAGIRAVEADRRICSVGRGGHPNLLGEVECDAAIMDGDTLQAGAVGALQGYLHAISVARAVMEKLPHTFLAGPGAARFAREVGAEAGAMLTAEIKARHERWLAEHLPAAARGLGPEVALAHYAWQSARDLQTGGTTVFLVIDQRGRIAGGASTSGWARKYPGRLGDSPVIGAGLYADGRYGVCGCTHTGEMTIRATTARSVILYMKRGATVAEACHEALEDLRRLKGGYLGPVVIHALDRTGLPYLLSTEDLGEKIEGCVWTSASARIESHPPVIERLLPDSVS